MSPTPTGAFGYKPNLPLAVVGTVVFGAVAFYHAFLFVRHRTLFFWAFLLAAFAETSGFGLRAYTTTHPEELRKYLVSYLLLILSPSLLTLSLFALFDRLLWYTTPPFRRTFGTTWVPTSGLFQKLFKTAYLVGFLLQWSGGATLVSSYASSTSTQPSTPDIVITAERLLKAGFMIQAMCTGIFAIIVLHFMFVGRRFTPSSLLSNDTPSKSWKFILRTTAITSILLILRSIYRVFEFSAESPKIKAFVYVHEFTFWTCDAAPMLAVLVLFGLTHPGHCLPLVYTKFWFRKGKVRRMEKKVLESQSWPSAGDVEATGGEKHGWGRDENALPWPASVHLPGRHR